MRKYRVATFTGEVHDPSSRYRIRQYIDYLQNNGVTVDDYFSKIGKYPPRKKLSRIIWAFKIILERINQVTIYRLKKYDLTILQREMISTLKTFEGFLNRPVIFDVDDAIHINKRGNQIVKIINKTDAIICGNQFLADYYSKFSNHIYILPTPVDTEKYTPNISTNRNYEQIIVGWIGTSGNFRSLYSIQSALKYILEKHTNSQLLIVSNERPSFDETFNYEFIYWSEEREISLIQSMDIGLMPLENNEWSKGKCSFKMLQYMSCAIPVVATPIGMNIEVFEKARVGFAPVDYYSDWISALSNLIDNQALRSRMGAEGRSVIESHYSLKVNSEKLIKIINELSHNLL